MSPSLPEIFTIATALSYSESKGRCDFDPLRSQFDLKNEGSPKYWLLPLSNFISEHWRHTNALDDHPLRVQPLKLSPPTRTQPLPPNYIAIG